MFLMLFLIMGCSYQSADKLSIDIKNKNAHNQATGLLAKTLPEITQALNQGNVTSEILVKRYLTRINNLDKNGAKLQAVLTVNPDAIAEAKKLDKMRSKGKIKGALHGIPILIKDNIESKDNMPTTAGALALKNNITGRDSPLVRGLRDQGAIILGKTNLSQWANFRSENSMSGWSALGGQVRNPHILDRNPCGSSSGSGAATAASLAAATVGTETNGSIICPANANGIVGFKPSIGLISQQYIIPISVSQDTAGPMTKSVLGAAMMMNAMTDKRSEIDYTSALDKHALSGIRIGVLNFAKGHTPAIINLFERALNDLKAAGAILVDINEAPEAPESFDKKSYDLLKYEFKDGLNQYLASTSAEQVNVRTLQDLINFNQQHKDIELALFDQSILQASQAMQALDVPDYQQAQALIQKATQEDGIDKLLQENNVEVLVSPSGPFMLQIDPLYGDVWPNDWPGFGSYAAIAGYPHITVPMGEINAMPIGLSFIADKNADAKVLAFAFAYEQKSQRRVTPQYFSNAEKLPNITKAMKPYNQ